MIKSWPGRALAEIVAAVWQWVEGREVSAPPEPTSGVPRCWRPSGNRVRCDRRLGHAGPCTWQVIYEPGVRQELALLKTLLERPDAATAPRTYLEGLRNADHSILEFLQERLKVNPDLWQARAARAFVDPDPASRPKISRRRHVAPEGHNAEE